MSTPSALVSKLWNDCNKRTGLDDFVGCYFGAPISKSASAGSETSEIRHDFGGSGEMRIG